MCESLVQAGAVESRSMASTGGRAHLFIHLVAYLACLATLLGGNSLFGGEPTLTLAMVRFDQLPKIKLTVGSTHSSAVIPQQTPAHFEQTITMSHTAEATLRMSPLSEEDFSFAQRLEKRPAPGPRDPLLLARRNLRNYDHAKTWASLRAGYGQVFDDVPRRVCAWSGPTWEEPSFGYLKVCFSF